MSIRQKKNRWQADITYKNERIRPYFVSRGDAIKWEETTRYELRSGITTVDEVKRKLGLTAQKGSNFIDIAEECLDNKWRGTKDEYTRRLQVKELESFFGKEFKAENVNSKQRDLFIRYLKDVKKNTNATINKKLSCIRVVLDFAKAREYIKDRPALPNVPDSTRFRKSYITEKQETQIVEFVENHQLESVRNFGEFWKWSMDTGLRFQESREVQLKDVYEDDYAGWVVMVQEENSKTREWRTVPLTDRALDMVKKQSGNKPWERMTKDRITKAWRHVRRHMNMVDNPEFVPYLTRHTLGSRLVQRTGNIKMAMEWMGHSNIRMTEKYSKVSPKNLLQGKEVLQQSK